MEGGLPEILAKWYMQGLRNSPVSRWDDSFRTEARRRIEEAEGNSDQLMKDEKNDYTWLSLLLSFFHFPIRVGSHQLLAENRHIEISLLLMSTPERFSRLLDCFPMEVRHEVAEDIWEPLLCFSRIPQFCLGIPEVNQMKLQDVDVSKWKPQSAGRMKRLLEEKNKNLPPSGQQTSAISHQSSSSEKPASNSSGNSWKEEYLANHRKHVEEFEKSYQFRKDVEPRLQQENADLFSSNKSLAHCVSEDMEMSAGIAKIFVRKFPDMKNDCWNQSVFVGGVAVYEDRRLKRYVYNLVTKKHFNDKPKYPDFISSLQAMKKHACKNSVTEISIPQIGCGLDGLNWDFVSRLIDEIFDGSGVQITVYIYDFANRGSGLPRGGGGGGGGGGGRWQSNASGQSFETGNFNPSHFRGDDGFSDARGKGRGRGKRQNDSDFSVGGSNRGRGRQGGGSSRGY